MTSETGKTALITGASSGIGLELTKLFVQDGYNVVLVARNDDKLEQLKQQFQSRDGQQVVVIGKDLAQEDVGQELYDEVKATGLTVNVLVNDAGVSTYGRFATETDWEREKQIIHLNVLTTTLLTKLFLKDMVARNEGRILQLSSMVAVTPFPLQAVYAATKAYILNFTETLRDELKDTNVTVTALMPNATATNFFREADAPKLNIEDMLDDPAMVAKDGYNALMKGELKVVPGGAMNKVQEVLSRITPVEALGPMMRKLVSPKDEQEREQARNVAIGVGIAAVVIAGIVVLASGPANRRHDLVGPVDKLKYRYKAGKVKAKAEDLLDGAEDQFDDAKEYTEDKWAGVKKFAGRVLADALA